MAMENIKEQILALLDTVRGNGSFETSGHMGITIPGLHIKGIGEIGIPLVPGQIKEIVQLSQKAAFGKGSKTVTDTNVRSAWELNADQLSFHNKDWEKFIEQVLQKVKAGLGIESGSIAASLYKLLVYEKGDFFLSHKDSEKEPGMFGTLIIGLPSAHTGGELLVRFDGKEESIDFSEPSAHYKMPYAAFFADCEHELKPITSGYRIVLVYNLIQVEGLQKPALPYLRDKAEEMAALLKALSESFDDQPKAVFLEHQYTPANFSLSCLKQHDRPRAEVLLEAARKAGYFALPGLVTHYKMGDLEGVDYEYSYSRSYRNQYFDDTAEGSMGEVYEEYTTIEYWNTEEVPGLGKVEVSIKDLITGLEIGEGEPVEKEEEGFTGNAGMTMEYWYHYGAVVLWPQHKHLELLLQRPVAVKLSWLAYYDQHWENPVLHAAESSKKLITHISEEEPKERYYNKEDYSIIAAILIKLKSEKFITDHCQGLLTTVFKQIQLDSWTALLQSFNSSIFTPIFHQVATRDDVYAIRHVLEVLSALTSSASSFSDPFLQHHINQVPTYLANIRLSKLKNDRFFSAENKRKETIAAILEHVITLSQYKEKDRAWINKVLEMITSALTRDYVNKVLIGVILGKDGVLPEKIEQVCISDLRERTAAKPMPPADWKRKVPATKSDREIWNLLRPFLESPVMQIFEYKKAQAYRSEMESAIRRVTVDLKMETIKKSTPHTLKLTKTQAAYERSLKNWYEDKEILEMLEK
jgi:hypothetical protein